MKKPFITIFIWWCATMGFGLLHFAAAKLLPKESSWFFVLGIIGGIVALSLGIYIFNLKEK